MINPALTIVTRKLRWLRKFDTGHGSPREIKVDECENIQEPLPQNGCNVELTRLTMPDDEQWFTLWFRSVRRTLRRGKQPATRRKGNGQPSASEADGSNLSQLPSVLEALLG